jgi:DNA-binding NarL/FixJ family response regulator
VVESAEIAGSAISSVQKIASELRPNSLDNLGLAAALDHEARRFQRRTRIACQIKPPEGSLDLPTAAATAVFRIFQEALTNLARHARANEVRAVLQAEANQVVLQVEDNGRGIGREALAALEKQACDVALVDINLPGRGGLELLQDLRELYPQMPAIVLSAYPERDYALRAFKLGASGYVSKQSAEGELLWAVRKALTGGRYVTPALAEALAAQLAGESPEAAHEMLSNRELQVLRLVALGKSLKEIAAELALSEKTIGTYRTRISQKLGLGTNVELACYAERHKLVD